QLRTRVRTIVATTWNYRQISTGTHRGLLDLWIKGANVRTQSRGSRMRLKTVKLINFRGYRDLVVPIDEAMKGIVPPAKLWRLQPPIHGGTMKTVIHLTIL